MNSGSASTPQIDDPPFGKRLGRHIFWAVGAFIILEVGALFAVHFPPPGQLIKLDTDLSTMIQNLVILVVISCLYVVVTGAKMRPQFRVVWRGAIFVVLILVYSFVEAGQAVAVVRSDTSFTFISKWPFSRRVVKIGELRGWNITDGKDHRTLFVETVQSGVNDHIQCETVRADDVRANQALDQLIAAVQEFQNRIPARPVNGRH